MERKKKAAIKVAPLYLMDVQLFEGQPCVHSTNKRKSKKMD